MTAVMSIEKAIAVELVCIYTLSHYSSRCQVHAFQRFISLVLNIVNHPSVLTL